MSIGLFGKKYVREDIAYLFYQKKAESSSVKHINGKKGYQIYEKHGTLACLFSVVYVFKLLSIFLSIVKVLFLPNYIGCQITLHRGTDVKKLFNFRSMLWQTIIYLYTI